MKCSVPRSVVKRLGLIAILGVGLASGAPVSRGLDRNDRRRLRSIGSTSPSQEEGGTWAHPPPLMGV